jgi:hypothetical protein
VFKREGGPGPEKIFIAPFPVERSALSYELFPDLNDDIRAHFGAKGASGALLLFFLGQTGHGKTLVINLIADDNTSFRAGQNAESAALAPLFLKNDFRHVHFL